MTALHAYFALRDQQSFQRLLESSRTGGTPSSSASSALVLSSSGGRSWTKHSVLSNVVPQCDVNARDWLGRTVLHLAAADVECSLEYVRLLMAHPRINVNAADAESRWTALHRAMYVGNVAAGVLLLQRPDIDTSLKDYEGYTAFDLYNATVEGTKPTPSDPLELYTWGTKRNTTLGTDADDRARPERVPIPSTVSSVSMRDTLTTRFRAIPVRSVEMSKLQTVVVTDEPFANLRTCGFNKGLSWSGSTDIGSSGNAPQMRFAPIRDLSLVSNLSETQIMQVALGQDHALAVTRAGIVLSWGSGRYAQLGYVIESGSSGPGGIGASTGGANVGSTSSSSQVVTAPRRIFGPLKKEFVVGVSASRRASACWTAGALYTWGTNSGQLGYGYDVVATSSGTASTVTVPTQVVPRRVTQVTSRVQGVALGDTAMAILLSSKEVVCFTSGRNFKISFPAASFPPALTAYRPPAAHSNMAIAKVVCADNSFATLSSNGELFTFSFPPAPSFAPSVSNMSDSISQQNIKNSSGAVLNAGAGSVVKPQRVWSLRKQFSAVRDIALGVDGTLVLCTESGHVYVRPGPVFLSTAVGSGASSGAKMKQGKFQKVQHLQRVVRVAAGAGALAALRADCTLPSIEIGIGGTLASDLAAVQPFLCPPMEIPEWYRRDELKNKQSSANALEPLGVWRSNATEDADAEGEGEDESTGDNAIRRDAQYAQELISLIEHDARCQREEGRGLYDLCTKFPSGTCALAHGADLFIQADDGFRFPVHAVVLAARSEVIGDIFRSKSREKGNDGVAISFRPPSTWSSSCPHAPVLHFTCLHPLSVLFLATYFYTDDLPALWDRRVYMNLASFEHWSKKSTGNADDLGVVYNPAQIRAELQILARILELPALAAVVDMPVKRTAAPTLARDLQRLFEQAQPKDNAMESRASADTTVNEAETSRTHYLDDPLAPNTVLKLADRTVYAHSVVLRARSLFFSSLFGDPVWTQSRRQRVGGVMHVTVQLRHMRWQVVDFVMRYMYNGVGEEMFDVLEFVDSVDDVLDFVYEVISIASELLIDRLLLICSNVVLEFVNPHNACTLLERASDFYLKDLISWLHAYIARNMEAILDIHSLDTLEPSLTRALSLFVRQKQTEKHPVTRSGRLIKKALERYAEWVEMEDFPRPIAPSKKTATAQVQKSSRSSIASYTPPSTGSHTDKAHASGVAVDDDDLFMMDPVACDDSIMSLKPHTPSRLSTTTSAETTPPQVTLGSQPEPLNTHGPWKIRTAQLPNTKVDLRTIIAETEAAAHPALSTPPKSVRNGTRKMESSMQAGKTPPRPTKELNLSRTEIPWRLPLPAARPVQGVNHVSQNTSSRNPSRTAARASAESLRLSPPGTTVMPTESRLPEVKANATSTLPKAHAVQAAQAGLGKGMAPLGPTFTPTRQTVSFTGVSLSCRVSDGNVKAWTTASLTHEPAIAKRAAGGGDNADGVAGSEMETSDAPLSFAEIQEQQQRATSSVRNVAKGLREIQEEERAQAERERVRRDEEAFLKWWAEEEERIRRETRAEPSMPAPSHGRRRQGGEGRKGEAKKKVEKQNGSAMGSKGALGLDMGASTSKGTKENLKKNMEGSEPVPPGGSGIITKMTGFSELSSKTPHGPHRKGRSEGTKDTNQSQNGWDESSPQGRQTRNRASRPPRDKAKTTNNNFESTNSS